MAQYAGEFHHADNAAIEKQRFFPFGTLPALILASGPMVGSETDKGEFAMFTTVASIRETATVFAGAFVSAMLLVSAATSLPIA